MKLIASAIAITLLFAPDTARQTFESAMQALNSGDYPAAEAGFNKVLEADPRNVSALANLGVLYAKTHRYGKAIQVYQRALRISPQLREIQLDPASLILSRKTTSMHCPTSASCTPGLLPTFKRLCFWLHASPSAAIPIRVSAY